MNTDAAKPWVATYLASTHPRRRSSARFPSSSISPADISHARFTTRQAEHTAEYQDAPLSFLRDTLSGTESSGDIESCHDVRSLRD